MAASLMVAAAAAILLLLGSLHLLYTFVGPRLRPRDPALQAQMQVAAPGISAGSTMWDFWVGFNVSHSLGVMLFGLVYGHLALTQVLGHGLRVVAYGLVGFSALARPELLVPLCVSVIAGTAFGKHFNGRISEESFALAFRLILIVLSLKLAWDGARGLQWI